MKLCALRLGLMGLVCAGLLGVASAADAAAPAVQMAVEEPAVTAGTPAQVYLVLAIDFSGTATKTLTDRIAFVRNGLEELKKPTATAWRKATRYRIWIVGVDAFGGDIIWRGSEQSLTELSDTWWNNLVGSRRTYGACTKLSAMWHTIGAALAPMRECDVAQLELVTDLIGEEPMAGTTTRCQPRQYSPSAEVPWPLLQRAAVKVYYAPDPVREAWLKPLAEHSVKHAEFFAGLDLSGAMRFVLPPTTCTPGPVGQQQAAASMKRIAGLILLIVVGIVALPFLLTRG